MFSSTTTTIPEAKSVPAHVAVIMDGNGRWAKKRGLPRIAGHKRGMESVREMVKACGDHGIKYLTLFAFSSENWRRPESEVKLLIDLFVAALQSEVRKLHENNVRLKVVGDLVRFGPKVTTLIQNAEQMTANNSQLTLTIAANYGGRWDITQACQRIAEKVASGELEPGAVDEQAIAAQLSTHFLPEPDLFIRTGGEQRISNYLLWQLAYSELYFTDVLWPEFGRNEFQAALDSFSKRQRRFGQTGDQVSKANNA
jgi:undecaprenyl diphosphate synthase